jgi:hypothetical protein
MTTVLLRWDGEAFRPATKRQEALCNKHFVVGQVHHLEERHETSSPSRAHFFATMRDIWASLPEYLEEQFPTPEHLRKHGLLKAGFYTTTVHATGSPDEAKRLAAAIRPFDDYHVVWVKDATVTVFTAQSMSAKAMDKKTFQEAKTKVLEWAQGLLERNDA